MPVFEKSSLALNVKHKTTIVAMNEYNLKLIKPGQSYLNNDPLSIFNRIILRARIRESNTIR